MGHRQNGDVEPKTLKLSQGPTWGQNDPRSVVPLVYNKYKFSPKESIFTLVPHDFQRLKSIKDHQVHCYGVDLKRPPKVLCVQRRSFQGVSTPHGANFISGFIH